MISVYACPLRGRTGRPKIEVEWVVENYSGR